MSDVICPDCGHPMTPGGVALGCAAGGKAFRIRMPSTCNRRECNEERSERALAKAIESGLIDP